MPSILETEFTSKSIKKIKDHLLGVIIFTLIFLSSMKAQISWYDYQSEIGREAQKDPQPDLTEELIWFTLLWALPKIAFHLRKASLSEYFSDVVSTYVAEQTENILLNGEEFIARDQLLHSSGHIVQSLVTSTHNVLENFLTQVLPDSVDLIFGTYTVCKSFDDLYVTIIPWYLTYMSIDYFFMDQINKTNRLATNNQKNYAAIFSTNLNKIKSILINRGEADQLNMLMIKFDSYWKSYQGKINTETIVGAIKSLIVSLGFWYIAKDSVLNSPKQFFKLMGLMNYLVWPLMRLSISIPSLLKNSSDIVELEESLHFPLVQRAPLRNAFINNIDPADAGVEIEIIFENVSYVTPQGQNILLNFNESFPWGSKILITGRNGAGKSTLFDLMLCLKNPTAGEIYLRFGNGRRILCISENKHIIRQYFSTIEQNPKPVNIEKDKNLALGKINKERFLHQARQTLFYHDVPDVRNSIDGYSGGEAQKMAITRALATPNTIALFDEPTSALDIDSQEAFNNALVNRQGTIFLITHNLGERELALRAGFVEVRMEDNAIHRLVNRF